MTDNKYNTPKAMTDISKIKFMNFLLNNLNKVEICLKRSVKNTFTKDDSS